MSTVEEIEVKSGAVEEGASSTPLNDIEKKQKLKSKFGHSQKTNSEFHEIACLVCPSCSFLEFPGCGVHSQILSAKKGNGHFACAGCVADNKAKGTDDASVSFLLHLAATDVSPPWSEACRNCSRVRADCQSWLISDDEVVEMSLAMMNEKMEQIKHVAIRCSDCRVLQFPRMKDGRLTYCSEQGSDVISPHDGSVLDVAQFPLKHYVNGCGGKPVLIPINLSKSEAAYIARDLPTTPYLPVKNTYVPGYIPPLKWITDERSITDDGRAKHMEKVASMVLGSIHIQQYNQMKAIIDRYLEKRDLVDELQDPDPTPVWRDRAYTGLFGDAFIRDTELEGGQIAPSIDSLAFTVKRILNSPHRVWLNMFEDKHIEAVSRVVSILEEGAITTHEVGLLSMTEVDIQNDRFVNFLERWHERLDNMQPGQTTILPGGWHGTVAGHALMHIIECHADPSSPQGKAFSFVVCNTGAGLQWHPSTVKEYPKIKYRTSLRFENIPYSRMVDAGYWLMFFRLQVVSSDDHCEDLLYEVILPHIAGTSVGAAAACVVDDRSEYRTPQRAGNCYFKCVLECFRYLLRSQGFSRDMCKQLSFAVRREMVHMVREDLDNVDKLHDKSDIPLIRMSTAQTAHTAIKEAKAGRLSESELAIVQELLADVDAKVTTLDFKVPSSGGIQPLLSANDTRVSTEDTRFPDFDMFEASDGREDKSNYLGYEVSPDVDTILDYASVPTSACETVDVALEAIATCLRLCDELSSQESMTSYFQRRGIIEHFMCEIIPIPLPHEISVGCVWKTRVLSAVEMRKAVNDLNRIARIYISSSFSLDSSDSDAARIITTAAILSVMDSLIRGDLTEGRSPIGDMFEGGKDGEYPIVCPSTENGGGRSLADLTANMRIVNPTVAVTRCRVLDYFDSMKKRSKQTVFAYPNGRDQFTVMLNSDDPTLEFVRHTAAYCGYVIERDHSGPFGKEQSEIESVARWLYSTDDFEVVSHSRYVTPIARLYPEFGIYRDTSFLFHLSMIPFSLRPLKLSRWTEKDATLRWQYRSPMGMDKVLYVVAKAFGNRKVLTIASKPESHEISAADPSKYVTPSAPGGGAPGGGLGGLFGGLGMMLPGMGAPAAPAESKSSGVSEVDVIHSKDLPLFDDFCTPEMSETLISYLTAPYLRVPLVVEFFSHQDHIDLLAHEQLRDILSAVLLEPGKWVTAYDEDSAQRLHHVPPKDEKEKDVVASPLGVLLNELSTSPAALLEPLLRMAQSALNLNTKDFRSQPSSSSSARGGASADEQELERAEGNSGNGQNKGGVAPIKQSFVQVILFVSRVVVQVEAYIVFILNHLSTIDCDPAAQDELRSYRTRIARLLHQDVHSVLSSWRESAFEAWRASISAGGTDNATGGPSSTLNDLTNGAPSVDFEEMSTIQAHIALLYRNTSPSEMTTEIMSRLLGSLSYVMTWHAYGLGTLEEEEEVEEKKGDEEKKEDDNPFMKMLMGELNTLMGTKTKKTKRYKRKSIPERDLFELLESSRMIILRWFTNASEQDVNRVLNHIIISVHGKSKASGLIASASSTTDSKEEEKELAGAWKEVRDENDARVTSSGRYVSSNGEVEIRLDTAQVFLVKNHIRPVTDLITRLDDYAAVFRGEPQHCALVSSYENRLHYKLFGKDYDLYLWSVKEKFEDLLYAPRALLDSEVERVSHSDERMKLGWWRCNAKRCHTENTDKDDVKCHSCGTLKPSVALSESNGALWGKERFTRKYGSCVLPPEEQWITELLEPVIQEVFGKDRSQLTFSLWLPEKNIGEGVDSARLIGCDQDAGNMWKEVRLLRGRNLVLVFNIVERARQAYRSLVYCSNARLCYADLTPSKEDRQLAWSDCNRYSAGIFDRVAEPEPCLTITRRAGVLGQGVKALGEEVFVSSEVLLGLLPAALLRHFTVWWSAEARELRAVPTDVTSESFFRYFYTARLDGNGQTSVYRSRLPLFMSESSPSLEASADDYTLLNPLYSKQGTLLSNLSQILSRVEDLSYCLFWGKPTKASSNGDRPLSSFDIAYGMDAKARSAVEYDLCRVELPRLKLTLSVNTTASSLVSGDSSATPSVRVYVDDFAGWFLSDTRDAQLQTLLEGLPFSLLLENKQGDLAVLVPNGYLYRPKVASCPFSTELVCDRGDENWMATMKTRCYLLPVHVSRTFLQPDTLEASMYLLLLRLLSRRYKDCMHVIRSCHTDVAFSTEEKWVFSQFESALHDKHPDAHAIRLRLMLAIVHSPEFSRVDWEEHETHKWTLKSEYEGYLTKIHHVSNDCMLSMEEEKVLLDAMQIKKPDDKKEKKNRASHVMSNRNLYVAHVLANKPAIESQELTHHNLQGMLTMPSQLGYYSEWLRWQARIPEFFTKVWNPAQWSGTICYERPSFSDVHEGMSLTEGGGVLETIRDAIEDNMVGSAHKLGFLFLYELLSNTLQMRLSEKDSSPSLSRTLGKVLLQIAYMKETEYGEKTQLTPAFLPYAVAAAYDIETRDPLSAIRSLTPLPYAGNEVGFAGGYPLYRTGWFISNFMVSVAQNTVQFVTTLPEWKTHSEHIVQISSTSPFVPLNNRVKIELPALPTVVDCARGSFLFAPSESASAEDSNALALWFEESKRTDTAAATELATSRFQSMVRGTRSVEARVLDDLHLEEFLEVVASTANVKSTLPFDLSSHPRSSSSVAQSMMKRLTKEMGVYATRCNTSTITQLIGLSAHEVSVICGERSDASKTSIDASLSRLRKLESSLAALVTKDREAGPLLFEAALATVNQTRPISPSGPLDEDKLKRIRQFELGRYSSAKSEIDLTFFIGALLSSTGSADLQRLNPYIDEKDCSRGFRLLVAAMMLHTRLGAASRALLSTTELIRELRQLASSPLRDESTLARVQYLSGNVSSLLSVSRHYVSSDGSFDPRFLVFEYIFNILLRKMQISLVHDFLSAIKEGSSRVHQMIMGAGKTTVVGPLLCLFLADGSSLVTQVVPSALLPMSRRVLRSCFSNIIPKQIFTLSFDRQVDDDPALAKAILHKLNVTVAERGVLICTDVTIKSLMLKYVELLHSLERAGKMLGSIPPGPDREALTQKEKMADALADIIRLWKQGNLLMDEVDLLLHPLRSELNFPIGAKLRLVPEPDRWQLPIHILDAVLYRSSKHLSVKGLKDNAAAIAILASIEDVISSGLQVKALQRSPHLVLLDESFYTAKLLPLLCEWALLWLKAHGLSGISSEKALRYLAVGFSDNDLAMEIVSCVEEELVICLNLAHDWLTSYLPHVLSKINRVSFGLLSASDLLHLSVEERMHIPRSRKYSAIPYIAKDVPSRSSEFAHPDVLIGLTALAYRIEGLRMSDLRFIINILKSRLQQEIGPEELRPSAVLFQQWINSGVKEAERQVALAADLHGGDLNASFSASASRSILPDTESLEALPLFRELSSHSSHSHGGGAGGPLQVSTSRTDVDDETEINALQLQRSLSSSSYISEGSAATVSSIHNAINADISAVRRLTLPRIQKGDVEDLKALHTVLSRLPSVVEFYLLEHVFPTTMYHQEYNLSASGQELGGNMLFQHRIGFSGTPSDLLPLELGSCHYEEGTDGEIMHVLTSENVVSSTELLDWDVSSLLREVACHDPPFHALIDTGALVTGMSNEDVARLLLAYGLRDMDAVVFLDKQDQQKVLLRGAVSPVQLDQCGVDMSRRFTFYDQIHTTGIDIKQTPNAIAAMTLGKDMTFRDFAQGAFRMRGIGRGQSIHLFVIPEIRRLIHREVTCGGVDGSDDIVAKVDDEKKEQTPSTLLLPPASRADIAAWLCVNSMRMEHLQFQQLCLQNASNVWRKEAFSALLKDSEPAANSVPRIQRYSAADDYHRFITSSIDLFRQDIDFTLMSFVPEARTYQDVVEDLIQVNSYWVKSDAQHSALEQIRASIRVDGGSGGASSTNHVFDREMVNEQEQETEQQKQVEALRDVRYERSAENPQPWALTTLGNTYAPHERNYPLYAFSQFSPQRRASILFPHYVLLSRNFFKPSWQGFRRVRAVHAVMEWVDTSIDAQTAVHAPVLNSMQLEAISQAFHLCDVAGNGAIPVSFLRRALPLLGNYSSTAHVSSLLASVAGPSATLTEDQFIHLHRRSAEEQTNRFFVSLSLEEAETLRRAIHIQHPAVSSGQVAIISLSGAVLARTPGFVDGPEAQRMMALQCMRFANCEMYYTPAETASLLRGISPSPPQDRRMWFENMLACKRKDRQVWRDAPVAAVFRVKDEYHLLSQKSLHFRIQHELLSKRLSLLTAFEIFDTHQRGVIDLDDLWTAIVWLGITATPEDVHEVMHSADINQDGVLDFVEFSEYFRPSPAVASARILPGLRSKELDGVYVKLETKAIPQIEEERKEHLAAVAPAAAATQPVPTTAPIPATPAPASTQPSPPLSSGSNWECLVCTFNNIPARTICEMCEMPRGSQID